MYTYEQIAEVIQDYIYCVDVHCVNLFYYQSEK